MARRAITNAFHVEEFSLEIQNITPLEDFIMKVPNNGVLQLMLQGDRMVRTPTFQLALKPWTRLVNAEQIQVDLEGIPLHAWEPTIAADLLRPLCSIEGVDPDLVAHRNVDVFRVTAGTTRQSLSRRSAFWSSRSRPMRKVYFVLRSTTSNTSSRSQCAACWFACRRTLHRPPHHPRSV